MNVNTCFSCDEEHRQHKTINLVDLKPNMDEIKNQLLELKKEIELIVDEIQIAIMKLNEFKEAMNIFYEINNDILNNYEMKNRNYQILENIKLITNNEIFTKLKKIDKMTDYKEKIFSIIDLYNKISSYDEDSQKNINIGNEDSSKNALFCKVALLGESNVGKTEIITHFIQPNFGDSITSTTGASYAGKTVFFDEENQSIKFEIWDTAGQEKYRALTKIFYKDVKVCILVYDITNKTSFDEIRNY